MGLCGLFVFPLPAFSPVFFQQCLLERSSVSSVLYVFFRDLFLCRQELSFSSLRDFWNRLVCYLADSRFQFDPYSHFAARQVSLSAFHCSDCGGLHRFGEPGSGTTEKFFGQFYDGGMCAFSRVFVFYAYLYLCERACLMEEGGESVSAKCTGTIDGGISMPTD